MRTKRCEEQVSFGERLVMSKVVSPMMVAYGAGVNSTAMLAGMVEKGIRPDAILFADTGGEKPETYEYLLKVGAWLLTKGMPQLTIVQNDGSQTTLEQCCLENQALPSIAYGWRTCSDRYKQEPQHKWVRPGS